MPNKICIRNVWQSNMSPSLYDPVQGSPQIQPLIVLSPPPQLCHKVELAWKWSGNEITGSFHTSKCIIISVYLTRRDSCEQYVGLSVCGPSSQQQYVTAAISVVRKGILA